MSDGRVGVLDVAQYILSKQKPLSKLKLQKLCYYAQAWSLVWDDEPLYGERIEAWAGGPVVPVLYRSFNGKAIVPPTGDPGRLNDQQRETIDAVLRAYGALSSNALVSLTHQEAPWLDARQQARVLPGERSNVEITLASMAAFYRLHGTVDPDDGLEMRPEFEEELIQALNTPDADLLTAEQMRSKLVR